MAAETLRLAPGPRDPAFVLLDQMFAVIDMFHDGGGNARDAPAMSKIVFNQVFTAQQITNIVGLWEAAGRVPPPEGESGGLENAYRRWLRTTDETMDVTPAAIMAAINGSRVPPFPSGYLPLRNERLALTNVVPFGRPNKKSPFLPQQLPFNPFTIPDQRVVRFIDVFSEYTDWRDRCVATPTWIIDPGGKPSDKAYGSLMCTRRDFDIDGNLLRCGPAIRNVFIRDFAIVDGTLQAKVVVQVYHNGRDLFIASSDRAIKNPSLFLQGALAIATPRKVNKPDGLICGNTTSATILKPENSNELQKAVALVLKYAGDGMFAEFTARNITDGLLKSVKPMYADGPVEDLSGPGLCRVAASYDILAHEHLLRIDTRTTPPDPANRRRTSTAFHRPAHAGKLNLELTPGSDDVIPPEPSVLIAALTLDILKQFDTFAASCTVTTCRYGGDEKNIPPEYTTRLGVQLSTLRETLMQHLQTFEAAPTVDTFNRLNALRSKLVPSVLSFANIKAPSPPDKISICRIGETEYKIKPRTDCGIMFSASPDLNRAVGIFTGVVAPRGGLRKQRKRRNVTRRRQRGGVPYDYEQLAYDLIQLYNATNDDTVDAELVAEIKARIRVKPAESPLRNDMFNWPVGLAPVFADDRTQLDGGLIGEFVALGVPFETVVSALGRIDMDADGLMMSLYISFDRIRINSLLARDDASQAAEAAAEIAAFNAVFAELSRPGVEGLEGRLTSHLDAPGVREAINAVALGEEGAPNIDLCRKLSGLFPQPAAAVGRMPFGAVVPAGAPSFFGGPPGSPSGFAAAPAPLPGAFPINQAALQSHLGALAVQQAPASAAATNRELERQGYIVPPAPPPSRSTSGPGIPRPQTKYGDFNPIKTRGGHYKTHRRRKLPKLL